MHNGGDGCRSTIVCVATEGERVLCLLAGHRSYRYKRHHSGRWCKHGHAADQPCFERLMSHSKKHKKQQEKRKKNFVWHSWVIIIVRNTGFEQKKKKKRNTIKAAEFFCFFFPRDSRKKQHEKLCTKTTIIPTHWRNASHSEKSARRATKFKGDKVSQTSKQYDPVTNSSEHIGEAARREEALRSVETHSTALRCNATQCNATNSPLATPLAAYHTDP